MMGHMYMSCYVTVMHLLNVLELREQVSKKIVCHHGLGFMLIQLIPSGYKKKYCSHFHCQLLK